MRDDVVADEVVRTLHFDVVHVLFGDGFDGDDAIPHWRLGAGGWRLERSDSDFHPLFEVGNLEPRPLARMNGVVHSSPRNA